LKKDKEYIHPIWLPCVWTKKNQNFVVYGRQFSLTSSMIDMMKLLVWS